MTHRPLHPRDDRPDSGRLLYGSSARLRLHRLGPAAWSIAESTTLAVWSAAERGDSPAYWRAINLQCDWCHRKEINLNAAAVRDAVRHKLAVIEARADWPPQADIEELGWTGKDPGHDERRMAGSSSERTT